MKCARPCPIVNSNLCRSKCSSEEEQIDRIMQVQELWEDSIDLYNKIKLENIDETISI